MRDISSSFKLELVMLKLTLNFNLTNQWGSKRKSKSKLENVIVEPYPHHKNICLFNHIHFTQIQVQSDDQTVTIRIIHICDQRSNKLTEIGRMIVL